MRARVDAENARSLESAQFTLEAQRAAGKTNPKLLNLIARIKLT